MSVRSFRMHAVSAARSKSWTRWLQPEREEASDSEEPDEAEGRDEDEQDPADEEAGSGRFVRIELKVLAEDMKSIAACSELLLAKEGVRDVRLVS